MIDLPLKIDEKELTKQLSELAKKKGYVTGNCSKEQYQTTIDRVEKCDRVKKIDQKAIAGDYSKKEMWMLHNLLIDYEGKNAELAMTRTGDYCLVAV